ncbi:MAG: type I methionyl aminopeptidase [Kiritimatiellae bacterium]|nr:type I methionyl aminopeptidase [Kiritimatiellia bacterium]
MIPIKSDSDLAGMRDSARLAAEVLRCVTQAVAPGVSTAELDQLAEKAMVERGAESAFRNYRGYPAAICVSVNEEVIHGIPGPRRIAIGDVVSVDVGVRYRGYCGDTAATVLVGVTDQALFELVDTAQRALAAGIAAVAPGRHLSDVSHAVEQAARAGGCSVVRDFVGHGIGHELHEEPAVPNYGRPGKGPLLQAGMVFCIEPMLNRGDAAVRVMPDKWTVVARDGRPSAHCEHMVAVVPAGVEVLTRI